MKKYLLALTFAALALAASRADAALLINIYNSPGGVVSVASGSINYLPSGSAFGGGSGNIVFSAGSVVAFQPLSPSGYTQYSLLTSPGNFGSGFNLFSADTAISGNLNFFLNSSSITTAPSYVQGSPISATATYSTQTLSSMQLNIGTYYYTWGDGVNTDTATLVISDVPVPPPAAVPEPGTWAAAAMLLGGAGLARWRKRAKVS